MNALKSTFDKTKLIRLSLINDTRLTHGHVQRDVFLQESQKTLEVASSIRIKLNCVSLYVKPLTLSD